MKAEIISEEKRLKIARAIKVYFKNNDISIDEVARKLGTTRQVVYTQLSLRRFTKKTAAKYVKVFGFSEEFLTTGNGRLIYRGGTYRTIVCENESLKFLVRVLKSQKDELQARNRELEQKVAELKKAANGN